MTNAELLRLDYADLLALVPFEKQVAFAQFVQEMNRREQLVRFDRTETFDTFTHETGTEKEYGYGFKIKGKGVPYFHPNRSFHDEVIWLNQNLYYDDEVTFEDRLINSCLVKFYGPSNTLAIMSRDTNWSYVKYDELINNEAYQLKVMENLHRATANGEKIFGTTELRTSLQTASRNYAREIITPFDKKYDTFDPTRKGRGNDIFYWFTYLGPLFVDFYKTKPTMEESFKFLNSFRGIGNYYGYHLSSNLARMPWLGTLLETNDAPTGLLDEDDDFVATGVGAMITVKSFLEHVCKSPNSRVGDKLVNAYKRDQQKFLMMSDEQWQTMINVSELGRFTTFGCEISLCQFAVFNRVKDNSKLAWKRADAPISKECALPKTVVKQMELF